MDIIDFEKKAVTEEFFEDSEPECFLLLHGIVKALCQTFRTVLRTLTWF